MKLCALSPHALRMLEPVADAPSSLKDAIVRAIVADVNVHMRNAYVQQQEDGATDIAAHYFYTFERGLVSDAVWHEVKRVFEAAGWPCVKIVRGDTLVIGLAPHPERPGRGGSPMPESVRQRMQQHGKK